jgi:hypothetical protein
MKNIRNIPLHEAQKRLESRGSSTGAVRTKQELSMNSDTMGVKLNLATCNAYTPSGSF